MPGSSPAKVKVTNIPQVGIVCKDVQNTVAAFWNILGVGPWSIFECGSSEMSDLKYRGKPTWGRFKVALAHMEPVGIELIEPLEGESIFTDRLVEEIGEGLHHINIVAAGMDAKTIEKEMAHQGFPSIQSGHFGVPGENEGGFNYIDIPPIHCIMEPVQKPKILPIEPSDYVP